MKAVFLKKYGSVEQAFELKEVNGPKTEPHQIKIKVDGFGLNYADVLSRLGLYADAPKLPCILGYECVGVITEIGNAVTGFEIGQRVLAFTRFGSYAETVVTDARAAVVLDSETSTPLALALGTQYCTAYYAAYHCLNLIEGDIVLVHAAAGGVGIAITQLAKAKGCKVIGTVGNDKKIEFAISQGADYAINYKTKNFVSEIQNITGGHKVDYIFDSVGGKTFKEGMKILNHGGANILFGASSRSSGKLLDNLKLLFGFGFYTPIKLLMASQAIIGVNMLRIADNKPSLIQQCLSNVYQLYLQDVIKPHVGKVFKTEEIASAHAFLESRNSVGKIAVLW